jgi:hypothetical protein
MRLAATMNKSKGSNNHHGDYQIQAIDSSLQFSAPLDRFLFHNHLWKSWTMQQPVENDDPTSGAN